MTGNSEESFFGENQKPKKILPPKSAKIFFEITNFYMKRSFFVI